MSNSTVSPQYYNSSNNISPTGITATANGFTAPSGYSFKG